MYQRYVRFFFVFIPLKEKATEGRFYGLISDLFRVGAK